MRFPLRVPLYRQREFAGAFYTETLNQPVRRTGFNNQTVGEAFDALPVQAVNHLLPGIGQACKDAVFGQVNQVCRPILAVKGLT